MPLCHLIDTVRCDYRRQISKMQNLYAYLYTLIFISGVAFYVSQDI